MASDNMECTYCGTISEFSFSDSLNYQGGGHRNWSEKDDNRCHERGTKKKTWTPTEFEPTSHWAGTLFTELRRTRWEQSAIYKVHISHASWILLGWAMPKVLNITNPRTLQVLKAYLLEEHLNQTSNDACLNVDLTQTMWCLSKRGFHSNTPW